MSRFDGLERRLAAVIPLPVYRALIRRDALGLVYHSVAPDPPAYLRQLYPCKTPQAFDHDLKYLKAHHNVISYDQLLAGQRPGSRLPARAVLITFDDGYAECHSVVRPLLNHHGLPAIFFIATDFIDNHKLMYRNKLSLCLEQLQALPQAQVDEIRRRVEVDYGQTTSDRAALRAWVRGLPPEQEATIDELCHLLGVDPQATLGEERPYLTADEIRGLAAEGFTIGAHSRQHIKFNRLTPGEIEEEVIGSCQRIMALTGSQRVPFAFPFSGYGLDGRLLTDLAGRLPYLDLFFDARGVRQDHPLVIDRVWADPPPEPGEGGSNIRRLMHQAFQEHALWRRRYIWTMLMAKRSAGSE